MNIEELSKSQLILLTILVNFIVSVGTGIITVSLLDHAPPLVTQTVNHVVERTIETVAQSAPATIIKSAPAPSNQDLVTAAIGADASRAVAFYSTKTGTSTPAIAVGTFLPNARAAVTAAQDSLPKEVIVGFVDGSYISASLSKKGNGLVIYGFSDDAELPQVSNPELLSSHDLKLGATALAIASDGSAATGIISRVTDTSVFTTLPNIGAGSAAVDLSGNLIGIAAAGTSGGLIPGSTIKDLLTATSTTATATSSAQKS